MPSIGVLDLQNNHLKDPEVLDILAAMPNLKVLPRTNRTHISRPLQYN